MDQSTIIAKIRAESEITEELKMLGEQNPFLGALLQPNIPVYAHEPAKAFEQTTGIKNIAGHYDFAGLSRDQIEIVARRVATDGRKETPEGHKLLSEMAQLLKLENPVLNGVKYNPQDTHQVWDMIMGAASGFNVDDMNFYIHENQWAGKPGRQDYNKAIDKLKAVVEERYPNQGGLGWIPSLETCKKIETQLFKVPETATMVEVFEKGVAHLRL